MYNMNSTEYLMIHYVLYTLNQEECAGEGTFTYDSAMNLVRQAGVNVTEIECLEDDDDDE